MGLQIVHESTNILADYEDFLVDSRLLFVLKRVEI